MLYKNVRKTCGIIFEGAIMDSISANCLDTERKKKELDMPKERVISTEAADMDKNKVFSSNYRVHNLQEMFGFFDGWF